MQTSSANLTSSAACATKTALASWWGLTNIGNVVGYERTENGLKPIEGKLYFRGL